MNTNSLFRQMRIVLFYDLPTTSSFFTKQHAKFRRKIINLGFVMMQESVYVKHCINNDKVNSVLQILKLISPSTGDIRTLTITEIQYDRMFLIRGEKTMNEKMQYREELVVI